MSNLQWFIICIMVAIYFTMAGIIFKIIRDDECISLWREILAALAWPISLLIK